TKFTYVVTAVVAGTSSTTPTAWTASTTATVSTGAIPHGFTNGMTVAISGAVCPPAGVGTATLAACPYNGTFTVAGKTSTTFTIALASPGVGATASGAITASSTIARATTTAAHGYSPGDSVTITGASCTPDCSPYNTTATISNVTSTTLDYTYAGSTILPDATGSGMAAADNTPSATVLANMLKWVRGQDTQNENNFQVNGANTDVRASIHGDILHSRPILVNYGVSGSTDNVYAFYGGNDGVFRAVKGGQATTDGKEQWAFIP